MGQCFHGRGDSVAHVSIAAPPPTTPLGYMTAAQWEPAGLSE